MRLLRLIILWLVALTALPSGIMMLVKSDGSLLKLTPELLANTPFEDFFFPGLFLIITGLFCLIAALLSFGRSETGRQVSLMAGVVLAAFISIQCIMMLSLNWLQAIYLCTGIFIIYLSRQVPEIQEEQEELEDVFVDRQREE